MFFKDYSLWLCAYQHWRASNLPRNHYHHHLLHQVWPKDRKLPSLDSLYTAFQRIANGDVYIKILIFQPIYGGECPPLTEPYLRFSRIRLFKSTSIHTGSYWHWFMFHAFLTSSIKHVSLLSIVALSPPWLHLLSQASPLL